MATSRKPRADAPTATFKVIAPIRHNDEDYAVGDPIELTEEQAKPLAGSFIEPASSASAD